MIILIKKELDNYQRKKKVVLKTVVYIGYITVHLFILFQTHNQTKGFFNDQKKVVIQNKQYMYFIPQLIEGTISRCMVLENHYLNYLNIYLSQGETIIAAILTALPWWRDGVRAVAWRSLLIRFHIFVVHSND